MVLVGGRSSRMGEEKAALEWHGSTLLRRTIGIVGRVVERPIIVVRAAGQALPSLDVAIDLRDDPVPGRGPLQGIAVGLSAAAERGMAAAFVCSVDLPLLHPAFVRAVLDALLGSVDRSDVALPDIHGHRQPLMAAYRTTLADEAARLLAEDRGTPGALFERCTVRRLTAKALLGDPTLAAADPELASATNINAPADYLAVRALAPPLVQVRAHDAPAQEVRAATLGAAAQRLGRDIGTFSSASIDGRSVPLAAEEPLAAGDRVHLHSG